MIVICIREMFRDISGNVQESVQYRAESVVGKCSGTFQEMISKVYSIGQNFGTFREEYKKLCPTL